MNLKGTAGFDNGQGSSNRCPTLPAFYHNDTLSHWRLAARRVLTVLLLPPPSLPLPLPPSLPLPPPPSLPLPPPPLPLPPPPSLLLLLLLLHRAGVCEQQLLGLCSMVCEAGCAAAVRAAQGSSITLLPVDTAAASAGGPGGGRRVSALWGSYDGLSGLTGLNSIK